MSSNQDEIYSCTNYHEQHHRAEPDAVSMIICLRTHKILLAILRMIRPGYEIQAVAGLQR